MERTNFESLKTEASFFFIVTSIVYASIGVRKRARKKVSLSLSTGQQENLGRITPAGVWFHKRGKLERILQRSHETRRVTAREHLAQHQAGAGSENLSSKRQHRLAEREARVLVELLRARGARRHVAQDHVNRPPRFEELNDLLASFVESKVGWCEDGDAGDGVDGVEVDGHDEAGRSTGVGRFRVDALGGYLGPGAGRGSAVDDGGTRSEDFVLVVDLHELERTPGPEKEVQEDETVMDHYINMCDFISSLIGFLP